MVHAENGRHQPPASAGGWHALPHPGQPTNGGPLYLEQEARTYLGEPFTKCEPAWKLEGRPNPEMSEESVRLAPPLRLRAMNHLGIAAQDVDAVARFWCKVMGFKEVARPDLLFPGRWLVGLGVMVHVIQADPSVPRRIRSWEEQYAAPKPEAWYIRRGNHVAFEVDDIAAAERRLREHGVEYSRHTLPDVDLQQLFFWDPEGNGIELSIYDDTRRYLEAHGEDLEAIGLAKRDY